MEKEKKPLLSQLWENIDLNMYYFDKDLVSMTKSYSYFMIEMVDDRFLYLNNSFSTDTASQIKLN